MPQRTYMVVDSRHDHSFRIPRPDLSAKLGTPNACNDCHVEKDPQWAAKSIDDWFGSSRKGFQTYAAAFHASRTDQADAAALLEVLAADANSPAIARASALAELAPRVTQEFAEVDGAVMISVDLGEPAPRRILAFGIAQRAAGKRLAVGAIDWAGRSLGRLLIEEAAGAERQTRERCERGAHARRITPP